MKIFIYKVSLIVGILHLVTICATNGEQAFIQSLKDKQATFRAMIESSKEKLATTYTQTKREADKLIAPILSQAIQQITVINTQAGFEKAITNIKFTINQWVSSTAVIANYNVLIPGLINMREIITNELNHLVNKFPLSVDLIDEESTEFENFIKEKLASVYTKQLMQFINKTQFIRTYCNQILTNVINGISFDQALGASATFSSENFSLSQLQDALVDSGETLVNMINDYQEELLLGLAIDNKNTQNMLNPSQVQPVDPYLAELTNIPVQSLRSELDKVHREFTLLISHINHAKNLYKSPVAKEFLRLIALLYYTAAINFYEFENRYFGTKETLNQRINKLKSELNGLINQ